MHKEYLTFAYHIQEVSCIVFTQFHDHVIKLFSLLRQREDALADGYDVEADEGISG